MFNRDNVLETTKKVLANLLESSNGTIIDTSSSSSNYTSGNETSSMVPYQDLNWWTSIPMSERAGIVIGTIVVVMLVLVCGSACGVFCIKKKPGKKQALSLKNKVAGKKSTLTDLEAAKEGDKVELLDEHAVDGEVVAVNDVSSVGKKPSTFQKIQFWNKSKRRKAMNDALSNATEQVVEMNYLNEGDGDGDGDAQSLHNGDSVQLDSDNESSEGPGMAR